MNAWPTSSKRSCGHRLDFGTQRPEVERLMILFSADSSLGMMIKMVKSWLKFKLEVPSSFIALIPKTFKRPIGVKVNDCANAYIMLLITLNIWWIMVKIMEHLIFIGPESDHWLCLSLTHSLPNWLTDCCLVNLIDVTLACEDANSKLVGCYCCWCWYWGSCWQQLFDRLFDWGADVWSWS